VAKAEQSGTFLTLGQLVSHYRIVEKLGEGGMGVVWKARDEQLGRFVALKGIPADKLTDPGRRARFLQEAQSASALNHPNIVTIYDLVHHADVELLVMEVIDGSTLNEKIPASGMRLRDALQVAIPMANALAAAHAAGIVHRDLKPGNVMVTGNGQVKVLDFGLAKLTDLSVSSVEDATKTQNLQTEEGVVVGTAAYMSPEQAQGLKVDGRSDIFSFGALLYEMVTGRRAFTGDTQMSTMAAVLERDPPPIRDVAPAHPRQLDRLITHCLKKNPEQRMQSMSDVALALEDLNEETSSDPAIMVPTVGRQRLPWVWLAGAAILAVLLTTAALRPRSESPSIATSVQFTVSPPGGGIGQLIGAALQTTAQMALSPDGSLLAFVAYDQGAAKLWLRPLNSLKTQLLVTATEFDRGLISPFWSPDGKSIGYFTRTGIFRVAASGGAPQQICQCGTAVGAYAAATWSREGTIVFSNSGSPGSPLQQVSDTGGSPTPVSKVAIGEIAHMYPQFLPDGKHLLYLARGTPGGVYVQKAGASDRKLLLQSNVRAFFSPPGFLLFQDDYALTARPFDATRLEFTGQPVRLGELSANVNPVFGSAALSLSENGAMVYRPNPTRSHRILSCDRAGRCSAIGEPALFTQMYLSPDDKTLATLVMINRRMNAWFRSLDSGRVVPAPFAADLDHADAVWSPDSKRVATRAANDKNVGKVQVAGVDGPIATWYAETNASEAKWVDDWTPDGKYVVLHGPGTIYRLAESADGEGRPEKMRDVPSVDGVRLSPDGQWIAYTSGPRMYVAPFPSLANPQELSQDVGCQPQWRRDGKELFFLNPRTADLMAVTIRPGQSFAAESPRMLFHTGLTVACSANQYAVTKDGQRFYVYQPEAQVSLHDLHVVLNWTQLLKP
jgi:serine/threonine protein kinase